MVTLAEVAQHAGVSASTVSYVLSGKRSISMSTRERVERSIQQLGYHPNAGARALASSRSNIIALMVPLRTDMYVPVMMEIAIAVATTARAHGYDVLLLTGEEGPAAVRRIAGSSLADAMILMDVELHDERLPLLRGDRPGRRAHRSARRDRRADLRGPRLRGHRGALRGAPRRVRPPRDRGDRRGGRGVRAAHRLCRADDGRRADEGAARAGVRVLHRPCEGGYAAMERTLARIFDERPGTTGFIVQNESAVEPLLNLLRQQGRAVPEDVSVVAICPEQVASAGFRAAHLGRHTRAGDGAARRRAGRREARRPRHGRSRAAGTGVDGSGEQRSRPRALTSRGERAGPARGRLLPVRVSSTRR